MKYSRFWLILAGVLLIGAVGCGHVELTPEGDPNRVVSGTVRVRMDLLPPPDAELSVRIIEPPDVTSAPTAPAKDLVLGEGGARVRPEKVLAENVIRAPASLPVSFKLEFPADDAALRHGLNIEARLTWGGRVRFRTIESQVVTLANADVPQTLWLEPVQ